MDKNAWESFYESCFKDIVLDWVNTKDLSVSKEEFLKFITSSSPTDVLESQEGSTSCGHIFAKGELIYTCHDCSVDDTCVLCQACFNPSDHKGHMIKYYCSRGNGGSCDCGEMESWKHPLNCPLHQSQNNTNSDIDPKILEKRYSECYSRILQVLEFIIKVIQPVTVGKSDKVAIVFYNDEIHSFDQVISCLQNYCGFSRKKASEFAHLVDYQGFASVCVFDSLDEPEIEQLKVDLSKTLEVEIQSVEFVERLLALNVISCLLMELCSGHFILKELFLSAMMAQINITNGSVTDTTSFFETIFKFDNHLWKLFRKNIHEFMVFGLSRQDVKLHYLKCFMKYGTDTLIKELVKGTREPHLTLLHFAVQVFTVPSLAKVACQERFPSQLCLAVKDIFGQFQLNNTKKFDKGIIDSFHLTCQILGYLMGDESVRESGILQNLNFAKDVLMSLSLAQNILPYERKISQHVEYESDDWIDEVNMTFSMLNYFEEFIRVIKDPSAAEEFIIGLGDLFVSILQSSKKWPSSKDSVTISFFQPVLWFLSALLEKSCSAREAHAIPIPNLVAIENARQILHLNDIKADFWIRNGNAVLSQHAVACGDTSFTYFTEYLTVFWHSLTTSSNIDGVVSEIRKMANISSLKHTEKVTLNSSVFRSVLLTFLMTIGGSNVGEDEETSIGLYIIHILSQGPTSFGECKKQLPSWVANHRQLVKIFQDVSSSRDSDSALSNPQYELKSECATKFNPFFWGLTDKGREKSMEVMGKRFGITLLDFTQKNIKLIQSFKPLFESDSFKNLLCDMFIISAMVPSLAQYFEYFVCLFDLGIKSEANFVLDISSDVIKEFVITRLHGLTEKDRLECIRILSAVLPSLVIENETGGEMPKSSGKVNSDAAAERRRRVLESMKAVQNSFQENNPDAIAVRQDNIDMEAEFGEPVESGTCLICQEPANSFSKPYGITSSCYYAGMVLDLDGQKDLRTDQEINCVYSCFHIIHQDCLSLLKSRGSEAVNCPLCNFPIMSLIIIPQIHIPTPVLSVQDAISNAGFKITQRDALPRLKLENYAKFYLAELNTNADAIVPYLFSICYRLKELEELGGQGLSQLLRLSRIYKSLLCSSISSMSNWTQGRILHKVSLFCEKQGNNLKESGLDDNHWLSLLIQLIAVFYPPDELNSESLESAIGFLRFFLFSAAFNQLDSGSDSMKSLKYCSRLATWFLSIWFEVDLPRNDAAFELIFSDGLNDLTLEALKLRTSKLMEDGILGNFDGGDVTVSTKLRMLSMIDLPMEYDQLFVKYKSKTSLECSRVTEHVICLFCGTMVCHKCNCEDNTENHVCGSGIGIYLQSEKCNIILCHTRFIKTIPAPYVNENNETDPGFRNGGPLKLAESKYNYLKRLWISGEMHPFILTGFRILWGQRPFGGAVRDLLGTGVMEQLGMQEQEAEEEEEEELDFVDQEDDDGMEILTDYDEGEDDEMDWH